MTPDVRIEAACDGNLEIARQTLISDNAEFASEAKDPCSLAKM